MSQTSSTKRSHFLSTKHLEVSQIISLINQAKYYADPNTATLLSTSSPLKNKIVANLFFENSTRTRCSFEIGAQKLGAYVLHFNADTASTQKGETLLDTAQNLISMGVDLLVIRHPEAGMPAWLAQRIKVPVINAGDGGNEHPTQAMLDILTILQHKPNIAELTVSIIGDILHSRVARSMYFLLQKLGVKEIRLIGPQTFLPKNVTEFPQAICHHHLMTGIENADVVMTLRVQRERLNQQEAQFDLNDYIQTYQLTANRLRHAKPDAIVMHPGPMNRGVEIASAVADGAQSVILEQPRWGVAMRMAIMSERFRRPVA